MERWRSRGAKSIVRRGSCLTVPISSRERHFRAVYGQNNQQWAHELRE
jgi:hypothetical protein